MDRLTKLNLGCGNDLRENYLNIDIVQPEPPPYRKGEFLQGDITLLYDLVGGGWEEILALFSLEHLDPDTLHRTIWHWNRCLTMNGLLTIVVPDFEAIVQMYLSDKNSYSTYRKLIYFLTAGTDVYPHRTCWTRRWIKSYLLEPEGFEVISTKNLEAEDGTALKVVAKKIHCRHVVEII